MDPTSTGYEVSDLPPSEIRHDTVFLAVPDDVAQPQSRRYSHQHCAPAPAPAPLNRVPAGGPADAVLCCAVIRYGIGMSQAQFGAQHSTTTPSCR